MEPELTAICANCGSNYGRHSGKRCPTLDTKGRIVEFGGMLFRPLRSKYAYPLSTPGKFRCKKCGKTRAQNSMANMETCIPCIRVQKEQQETSYADGLAADIAAYATFNVPRFALKDDWVEGFCLAIEGKEGQIKW